MQLASAYGMKVIGTAGTTEGENAVKQAGASLVFNHRQDGYVEQILVGLNYHFVFSLCKIICYEDI